MDEKIIDYDKIGGTYFDVSKSDDQVFASYFSSFDVDETTSTSIAFSFEEYQKAVQKLIKEGKCILKDDRQELKLDK